jgi:type I restriction enzyme S subunit
MGWPLKTIDELGHVSRGRSRHRPRDAEHLYGGPYPFIQTSDVKHSALYINEFSQTYSEAGLAQSKLWKAGTLCITIAANIADTAILGIDACFPDSIIGFIPEPEKADARFIKYLFDALLQRRFQRFTQGAAQDNLSQEKLLSLRFPTPGLRTQKRIADILSAYDDLIENNRRRIQLLEQSARMLYKEWFVHLRFPGHERVKIKDGVPEGWGDFSLAELADSISYGYTASADLYSVGPKFLRITDIVPEVIDWAAVPFCKISEKDFQKFSLQQGDIVVARTGATVGYAKRIGQTEHDAVFASYLVRFRFNEKIDDTIAGIFMESQDYKTFVRNNAGGAAQPNANAGVLSAARLLVPPKSVQKNFRELVEPVNQQKGRLQKQNRSLMKARDLLLPRLMNGEVEV